MKLNALVTWDIDKRLLQRLEKLLNVTVLANPRDRSADAVADALRGKVALICLLTDSITRDVIERGDCLRVISNCAVGYNNIDVAAASERGIAVCNTPGVLTETTADLTWALILGSARRIVEGDKFVREGKFNSWRHDLLLGHDVYGKTLGIVGMGRIGKAVARRAAGFNMRVVYASRSAHHEIDREFAAEKVELSELLSISDYVSIHLPLTVETHHLIDRDKLALMRRSAYLINTGRGPVVDEEALFRALEAGQIAGAALDVYEHEPEVHPGLLALANVVLLPHIGSATEETRFRMAEISVENALAILSGRKPFSVVNDAESLQ